MARSCFPQADEALRKGKNCGNGKDGSQIDQLHFGTGGIGGSAEGAASEERGRKLEGVYGVGEMSKVECCRSEDRKISESVTPNMVVRGR